MLRRPTGRSVGQKRLLRCLKNRPLDEPLGANCGAPVEQALQPGLPLALTRGGTHHPHNGTILGRLQLLEGPEYFLAEAQFLARLRDSLSSLNTLHDKPPFQALRVSSARSTGQILNAVRVV
jgi:hypothetical protein